MTCLRHLGCAAAVPDEAGRQLFWAGTTMPDCRVLLTAEQTTARVATFDDSLRAAATSVGLQLVPMITTG